VTNKTQNLIRTSVFSSGQWEKSAS